MRQLLGNCRAPHPKVFTSICQSWHGAGLGSTPPLWGLWGEGLEAQGTGGRKEPSHLSPPQARKVKDTSRQPGSQTGLGPGTLGFPGVVVVRALAGCRHLPPSQARHRGPRARSVSPSKRENVVTAAPSGGWWSLLPGYPPAPSPTLSKGTDPRAEPGPRESAFQAEMARGGRGQLVTLASPRQTLEASP